LRGERRLIEGQIAKELRVSLKPNDWRFLDMSGYILLALGDTNVALEDFIAALRIKCRQLLRRPGKAKPSPGP
jgi:hypothetical protein